MTTLIRQATTSDLLYVTALQKRFSNAVGFLPRVALSEYLDAGSVLLATENGEPAGYLLFRPRNRNSPTTATIIQAAIQLDAQRRQAGKSLLRRLQDDLIARGTTTLQAKCAADLESNLFWAAVGFLPAEQTFPLNARGRAIILHKKPISR